ncbi:MAG: efflux RND transporter permease subunit [Armatimonadota bacterium]
MRWLAELSVRRPVLASVLVLSLVFVGLFSYYRLNVERFPNVDIPFISIGTTLPGASPEEVESDVTEKIEKAVNTIGGVDTLSSTSAEGFSQVNVQFVLEKNIDVAAQEVRDKINGILPELPTGIDPPVVSKFDPGAIPVLTLALAAERPVRDLTEYADKVIRPRLESVDGVGQVEILGGRARQINVWIDPARLEAYGLNTNDVIRALQSQNVQVPAGSIDQGTQRFTLRALGRVESIAALPAVVLANRQGVTVTLADVGRVEDGAVDSETVASLDGRPAVLLRIVKQSGTNTINVVHNLRARLTAMEPTLAPGHRLQVVRDQSVFVEASTHAVQEHLILGAILAALVVFVFLRDVRSTVIAAIAIPTSLISTFALLSVMGLTLNIVTLLALALVVGIVIDDAIVVNENIYRFITEKGMKPFEAAIEGTREVASAVTATTMSLIAVFLPLAFMSGIVGRFMRSFGWTMAFAIGVSLLVSFTLTPMLSARWLKAGGGKNGRSGETARGGRMYMAIEHGYQWLLRRSLRRRWIVAVLSVVTLVSIVPLGSMVAQSFLPEDDESQFEVVVRAPEGWSLDTTARLAEQMAAEIRRQPGTNFTIVTVADDAQRTPNRFTIFVQLVGVDERSFSQEQAADRVRREMLPRYAHLGLRTQVGAASDFGGGSGSFQPIDYVISGPDLEVLTRASQAGEKVLRGIQGVVDVRSSLISGKPQLGITIDRDRAADLGVSVLDAAGALRVLVRGQEVSTYAEGGQQYDIVVRAEEAYRVDLAGLRQLTVASTKLGAVPLEQVVHIKPGVGPSAIDHYNRSRQVQLTANLLPGVSQVTVLEQLDREVKALRLGPEYSVAFAGQAAEQGRQAAAFMTAFGLSFVFMYLVLAAQFESWLHPITILLSLPLTVPFALLSIILLRGSLNIFSQLGILVLFGVVKKNAILQIDHANQLRAQGMARDEAIVAASRDRLRPILMTTVAFVAGMMPLALSSGVGAASNRAISSVIIGGQTLSLVLTLVAIPVFYSLFDDLGRVSFLGRMSGLLGRAWQRIAEALKTIGRRQPTAGQASSAFSKEALGGDEAK